MKAILISGSPGAGKSTAADALSELYREDKVAHAVVDPDQIARTYPENSHSLKWDSLSALQPVYQRYQVQTLIIPVTIDSNQDLLQIKRSLVDYQLILVELCVDENTLLTRVQNREPNTFWKNKLTQLVRDYAKNEASRTFPRSKIDANNQSIAQIVNKITAIVSRADD